MIPGGHVGSRGKKGDQGPPGPRGFSGFVTRNWKQCVYKNLNDDRDSGLVKVKYSY